MFVTVENNPRLNTQCAQCICVLLKYIVESWRRTLETDQHTHDEQSDVIVLVIGGVWWHNMADCV